MNVFKDVFGIVLDKDLFAPGLFNSFEALNPRAQIIAPRVKHTLCYFLIADGHESRLCREPSSPVLGTEVKSSMGLKLIHDFTDLVALAEHHWYKRSMRSISAFTLTVVLAIPSLCLAGPTDPSVSCENALLTEFARTPDDDSYGFITSAVPVNVQSLKLAYSMGIFPMGTSKSDKISWYNPPMRGILEFDKVHIPKSDRKFIRQALERGELKVTFNQAFREVITACRTVPRWEIDEKTGEKVPAGQWLTEALAEHYIEMHKQGYAHSVEVWRGDRLVGGLYGMLVNGVYAGESMFHLEPDVTKLAFYSLIEKLKAEGYTWMDTQQTLGLVKKWGGQEVPRKVPGSFSAAQ